MVGPSVLAYPPPLLSLFILSLPLFGASQDTTIASLNREISTKLTSLKLLESKLREMLTYLNKVVEKKMAPDHDIMALLQSIFNLSPNLRIEVSSSH